jgi:hypothetical protein
MVIQLKRLLQITTSKVTVERRCTLFCKRYDIISVLVYQVYLFCKWCDTISVLVYKVYLFCKWYDTISVLVVEALR